MPTAKKSSVSPTQRTIALLKKRGYVHITRVEHWNSFARRRIDLWGFDLVAFKDLGNGKFRKDWFQMTTNVHRNEREVKLRALATTDLLRLTGDRCFVHGWRKIKGKWECDERELV